MPLHLLGKKSWNVYNVDNIEKVKRDEAVAKALEEEDERRMQEADAQGRLETLRGNQTITIGQSDRDMRNPKPLDHERQLKKRRIGGEDDTDRDIRLAKASASLESTPLALSKRESLKSSSDAPLTDAQGHISLFPEEPPNKGSKKNVEAEAEKAKKKQEYEDQYTMRFSNAAGFKQKLETPWYSSTKNDKNTKGKDQEIGKDVWGNEDRGRISREKARLDANDPLAFMKKSVKQLRDVETERRKWQKERAQELNLLEKLDKSSKRRHRSSHDELEDLSLDTIDASSRQRYDIHSHSESKRIKKRRRSNDYSEDYDGIKRHSRRHHDNKHRISSSSSGRGSMDNQPKSPSRSLSHISRPESSKRHRSRHKSSESASLTEDGPGWKPGLGGRYSNQFATAS